MIENVRIVVDEAVVVKNTEILRATLNKTTKIISVIKANGYGLGIVEIAKTCEAMKIDMLAVLDIPQALQLRQAGIKAPILLLGQTHHQDFALLHQLDLVQVLLSHEFALALSQYAQAAGVTIRCHLKVNTGLNRLGFDDYETILEAYAMKGLNIEGIYSHFVEAQSDADDGMAFTNLQIERFKAVVNRLKADGIAVGMTHMQNSPSILQKGDLGFDAVRCGMIMFGLFHPNQLTQAMALGYRIPLTLESNVAVVRDIQPGAFIGYGRSYAVTKPMSVATISAGYCDGIIKQLSLNHGGVVIQGVVCPILGDIAMSQFMVDVTGLDVKMEDSVAIFDNQVQTIYDYITNTKQSINEFIGGLRMNIPRIYINQINQKEKA